MYSKFPFHSNIYCTSHGNRRTLKLTANTNLKFPAVIRPQWKSTLTACIVLKLLSHIGRLSLSKNKSRTCLRIIAAFADFVNKSGFSTTKTTLN